MPDFVEISPEQLRAFQASQSELETLRAANQAASDRQRASAGDLAGVLAESRARASELDRRSKMHAVSTELARVLASERLVPEAAAHVHSLLSSELFAEASGDGFRVQSRNFEPVSDFVARQLARPEFQHFREAPPAPPAPAAPPPSNLGQAVILRAQEARAAQAERVSALDPRTSMAVPFGLKPKR